MEGAVERVRTVARSLGVTERGEKIIRRLQADLAAARSLIVQVEPRPRVLFIYARGAGTLNVSGTGTPADEMIRLAGGINAISLYEGFKPLTAEAAIAAAPDVFLLPQRGLSSLGGVEGLLALPGLALTPAGRARRVAALEDLYLLGFGPRTGRAVGDLARLLHPRLREESPRERAPEGQ